jgi:3-phosphoshikimate 1-carboxyvinyltransferase
VASVLIANSNVTLRSIGINPTRIGLLTTLRQMGADIRKDNVRYSYGEPMADLTIRGNGLQPIEIGGDDVASMIDELPILAIAATQAQGVTTVGGASELRLKESDRILEITKGLRQMGANIEAKPDGFIIEGPTPLYGAEIHPNGDHRIAMAFTVAGLIAEGTTRIVGADCIAESYPDFSRDLNHLGADIR